MHGTCGEPASDDPNYRRCTDCSKAPRPGWPQPNTGGTHTGLVALASALIPPAAGELGGVASGAGGATGSRRDASALSAPLRIHVHPLHPRQQHNALSLRSNGASEAPSPGVRAVPALATISRTELTKMGMPALTALARKEGVAVVDARGLKRKRVDVLGDLRARLPRRRRTQEPLPPPATQPPATQPSATQPSATQPPATVTTASAAAPKEFPYVGTLHEAGIKDLTKAGLKWHLELRGLGTRSDGGSGACRPVAVSCARACVCVVVSGGGAQCSADTRACIVSWGRPPCARTSSHAGGGRAIRSPLL